MQPTGAIATPVSALRGFHAGFACAAQALAPAAHDRDRLEQRPPPRAVGDLDAALERWSRLDESPSRMRSAKSCASARAHAANSEAASSLGELKRPLNTESRGAVPMPDDNIIPFPTPDDIDTAPELGFLTAKRSDLALRLCAVRARARLVRRQ